ncbi:hypothetical protein [Leptospira santarosai]|uniref:Peptidase, M23 family n=1 Tax=Leptospira santarosai str. ZUN179 TaxID=1049985 RepID=M6UG02_9LEPT|nr:hypothetical protein [Leptospira santarosai]EMO44012.1 hypothetical protein LEP1GSC187_1008 [Leptospira santarosai str. ZUN179]
MPSLKERLDITLLEKHQAWHEARGMLSPSKMLTTISPNQTNHLQSVDMMDPNNTRFNAEMVLGLKGYIDNLQKNVEAMFAQFSNKTEEIKEEYAQNQEIESYQKKLYEASKENYVAAFQVLPGDLEKTFQQEMNGLKGYHEQGSKYNFNEGSFKDQSGDMKKVGKSMYDGANIEDTVFAGSRELKGSVSVKGIPVEISYGMQHLLVTSGFNISNLGFNFKLKGVGTNYVDNQLSGANQKYSIYSEDISARIEKQAKANDEEKESKGFLFTILNGMNGGSGSMGQRFTQAVRSEAQSRITGAVAEATGLPASLVGALVGGSSMKDAVKAYVKDETTNAISKATGIPAWMISNQMEKMNKPKEQWYQSQTFQMVTTVVAVAAAPFTGGASLLVAMSIGAGIGAATGAASGGLKGALVGAVGGAAGAAVKSFTGGAVTVGLSYSAENGFGASVGVGYGPATVNLGISERGGTTVDLGLKKGGFNAGLSYNSKTGSVSGNAGLEIAKGSSLGISYNEGDGFGASISKSLDSGLNGSLSWSQKGGVGGSIGYEAPGDKNQPKNSLANQMQGAGGSLSFNQRDGVSASVSASGGVNAGNWSQSGGFQANTNFLTDQWKADYQTKQAELEQAKTDAESKAAQDKNNQETGKSVLDGAAISTQRREDHDHDEFSYGIGGDELKKGLNNPDGFDLTPGEKKFIEDRMKLDQAKAQGGEAYMAALKKGNTVERMPDSITTTKDGKEVRTYRHNETDKDGSNIKTAMQVTTDPKTGKTTYGFARQQEFDLHPGVAPHVELRDGKAVVNSPFGERWGKFHNGNDLAHSGKFMAPVDIENVKVTQGKERYNKDGKAVGIWKESNTVKTEVNGMYVKTNIETLHTMVGDKSVPYTREMATADYNAHPTKNQTYDQLMATPAKQMSKDGNSVSGTYRIGDQDYTLRFKHLSDLSQVQNSNGSFKSSISKGSAVGIIASTGYSTGNHAHFQVESGSYLPTDVKKYTNDMNQANAGNKGYKPNYSIDPIYFLNQMAGPNEMK